jgi:hypothetical protein
MQKIKMQKIKCIKIKLLNQPLLEQAQNMLDFRALNSLLNHILINPDETAIDRRARILFWIRAADLCQKWALSLRIEI